MKYRLKPTVVDAFQWTGDENQTEDPEWLVDKIKAKKARVENEGTADCVLLLKTMIGTRRAERGDWVIHRGSGIVDTYKDSQFLLMFEPHE